MSDRTGAPGGLVCPSPPTPTGFPGAPSLSEEHVTYDIRIWRLRNKRRDVAQQLRAELKRPQPDTLVVQELKRLKLRLKDELARIEALAAKPA